MELSYTKETHPTYGEVYVIRVMPDLWEDFKEACPEIQWEEVHAEPEHS